MTLIYLVVALILVAVIAWLVNIYFTVPKNIKTIVNVVLGLIVVGVGLFLINTYIPMAGSIKGLLNIVVFLAACVGVLQAVGLWKRIVAAWDDFVGDHFHSDHNHISTP